jgi:murein L,D-transpeptidase YafK
MWKKNSNYFFSFFIKNLQIRYETWRHGREIAKAYGKPAPFQFPRLSPRVLGICAVIIVAPLVVFFAAPYGIKSYGAARSLLRQAAARHAVPKKTEPRFAAPPAAATPQASVAPAQDSAQAKIAVERKSLQQAAEKDTTKPQGGGAGFSARISPAMDYCIIANKANRTLYLLNTGDKKGTWKTIETFSILVGRNEGQKMSEGDHRTPEGAYFIIGRKESEELNAIYGPLAYILNYPNEDDRKAGRTGQGIWIHGTREDTTREATRGCVVLNNDNMLTLARYLQLGIGTPVMIVNSPQLSSPQLLPNTAQLQAMREHILNEYDSRQNEFQGIVAQWKLAWESRDIDKYSGFYDADRFSGEGMRWSAWRDKKERTFKTYNMISIGLDKICVSEFSETTAVVMFMQRYESEVFRLQKPKKLSFVKNDGRWKIFKEETFSRQELLL